MFCIMTLKLELDIDLTIKGDLSRLAGSHLALIVVGLSEPWSGNDFAPVKALLW
jgi:hypothetical protein